MEVSKFDSLFEIDADETVVALEKLSPTFQVDCLEKAFAKLFADNSDTQIQSRAILIVQSLLTNSGGAFIPNECPVSYTHLTLPTILLV